MLTYPDEVPGLCQDGILDPVEHKPSDLLFQHHRSLAYSLEQGHSLLKDVWIGPGGGDDLCGGGVERGVGLGKYSYLKKTKPIELTPPSPPKKCNLLATFSVIYQNPKQKPAIRKLVFGSPVRKR